MDINSLGLVSGLRQAMGEQLRRQQVIAENIANAETPGFKAREAVAQDFPAAFAALADDSRTSIARPRVSPTERAVALGAAPIAEETRRAAAQETRADGNNVSLEGELLKMGDVQAQYAALTSLYRKSLGLIRTAVGRTG
jgi:flagellar basal-body rod protein FlgB